MARDGRPLSELRRVMRRLPQVLLNVRVRRAPRARRHAEGREGDRRGGEGARRRGRVLVRYSGTEALARVMVEGESEPRSRRWPRASSPRSMRRSESVREHWPGPPRRQHRPRRDPAAGARVDYPDPVEAARAGGAGGADGITVHLREDRRHIQDRDVERLRATSSRTKLNLEMAATEEMVAHRARAGTAGRRLLVPERREELTTEGGLDVAAREDASRASSRALGAAGIRVSLFIDPDPAQSRPLRCSRRPAVELHTGAYAKPPRATHGDARARAAPARRPRAATRSGSRCNAGHGLTVDNVGPVAAIPEIDRAQHRPRDRRARGADRHGRGGARDAGRDRSRAPRAISETPRRSAKADADRRHLRRDARDRPRGDRSLRRARARAHGARRDGASPTSRERSAFARLASRRA